MKKAVQAAPIRNAEIRAFMTSIQKDMRRMDVVSEQQQLLLMHLKSSLAIYNDRIQDLQKELSQKRSQVERLEDRIRMMCGAKLTD